MIEQMGITGLQTQMRSERKITGLPNGVRSVPYGWHRRFAIPLAYPAAFFFYINHLALPHSWSEMLTTKLSRRWSSLGRAMMLVHRQRYDPARLHEPQTGITVTTTSEDLCLNHDFQWHLRTADLETYGPFNLLTLSDDENLGRGQTVAFLFNDSSQDPLAVAKLSIDPRQRSVLKNEYKTLKWLTHILGTNGSVRVPQPLAFFESSPWTVLLESCLPGSTAYFEMRNSWNALKHAPKHFRLALEWLLGFQRAAGIKETRMNDATVLDYVARPLQQYAARFCPSAAELQLITNTTTLARRLVGAKLVRVARHGDFWAGNLAIHNSSAGVVDWELFESETLPFDDLLFFPTTYGLNYPWKLAHWATPETTFQATYLQSTEIAYLVRNYLLSYCHTIGLECSLLDVFFPVFLAKRALMQTSCVAGDAGAWVEIAQTKYSQQRTARSGTHASRADMWRHFFRIYAERNNPACFSDQEEEKEAVR